MTITIERFTKSSREKIFEVATNFQNYPTWMPQYFPSTRIISVRPNTTLVEEHRIISGKELVVMAKHMIKAPLIHEILFVGGDAKGTHIVEDYELTPQGTKIKTTIDFKSKMSLKLSGLFGNKKIENEFGKIIDELIIISEG